MSELNKILSPPSMNMDASSLVIKIKVTEGEHVSKHQIIAVLESGKHYLELPADENCVIEKILCKEGENVPVNSVLFETRPK